MPITKEERLKRFEAYERNKTPEDIRVETLEEENDERYLADLDPNESSSPPDLPIEALWKAWGLEDRAPARVNPRNRKTA
jgi:hypothetical protein